MAGSTALAGRDAGVGLVHYYEFWTGTEKLIPAFLGFDVVEGDDDDLVMFEDALNAGRELAFKPRGCAGHDQGGLEMELFAQFKLPLVHKVRWTDDCKTGDFSTVTEFAGDES